MIDTNFYMTFKVHRSTSNTIDRAGGVRLEACLWAEEAKPYVMACNRLREIRDDLKIDIDGCPARWPVLKGFSND